MTNARTVRPIPEDTASAGKAFFKKGSFYRNVGDHLGDLCRDSDSDGSLEAPLPHVTIPLLFLITVFQYLESLSDSQAAAAVLSRVDWKYALHLPLVSLGFDEKELEQYHSKLLADPTIIECLSGLLARVQDLYGSAPRDLEKVDTASMLSAVRTLNRLSQIVRAMRLALDELATYCPDWLKKTVLPHWLQRYAHGGTDEKAPPSTSEKREALALAVGEDGFILLDALDRDGAPPEASSLPEVEYFRHVWSRQFERTGRQVVWRASPVPPAVGIPGRAGP